MTFFILLWRLVLCSWSVLFQRLRVRIGCLPHIKTNLFSASNRNMVLVFQPLFIITKILPIFLWNCSPCSSKSWKIFIITFSFVGRMGVHGRLQGRQIPDHNFGKQSACQKVAFVEKVPNPQEFQGIGCIFFWFICIISCSLCSFDICFLFELSWKETNTSFSLLGGGGGTELLVILFKAIKALFQGEKDI